MKSINLILGLTMLLLLPGGIFAQSMDKPYKTIRAERRIKAPAARVWQAMVLDYGEISNFAPSIYASNYERGSLKGAIGAERKCSFNKQGSRWTHEKIRELDNDKMVMKNVIIDAAKFPLNKDNSYAIYRVEDNGDGTATASYTFHFRAKPAFMSGMMKASMTRLLEETLVGLEHYVSTGEIVNATTGNWKEIKQQYH
ncbi:MAG: SRPBCC family protein [Bacteroidota bacterium]